MQQENQAPVEIESTEIVALDLIFKPEVFDPNKDQLRAIAEQVSKIEANPELMTKEDLELINTTKNQLVKARTRIQKIGKAQREPATKYAKEVKAYEDELLEILAPQEARMKDLEASAKAYAMKQERLKTLPEFIEKLNGIGDGIEADQEFLLSLDPNQRDAYYVQRLTTKVEADAAAIKAQQEAAEAAKNAERTRLISTRREILIETGFKNPGFQNGVVLLRLETTEANVDVTDDQLATMTESEFAEKADFWRKLAEAKKAADLAATEARAKEQAEKEAAQRAADEEAKRQAEAKAAEEEATRKAEQLAKEEAARRSSEAYQQCLNENSYNESTDKIEQKDGVNILYRVVATYQPTE
jgi:hypothetical protein